MSIASMRSGNSRMATSSGRRGKHSSEAADFARTRPSDLDPSALIALLPNTMDASNISYNKSVRHGRDRARGFSADDVLGKIEASSACMEDDSGSDREQANGYSASDLSLGSGLQDDEQDLGGMGSVNQANSGARSGMQEGGGEAPSEGRLEDNCDDKVSQEPLQRASLLLLPEEATQVDKLSNWAAAWQNAATPAGGGDLTGEEKEEAVDGAEPSRPLRHSTEEAGHKVSSGSNQQQLSTPPNSRQETLDATIAAGGIDVSEPEPTDKTRLGMADGGISIKDDTAAKTYSLEFDDGLGVGSVKAESDEGGSATEPPSDGTKSGIPEDYVAIDDTLES